MTFNPTFLERDADLFATLTDVQRAQLLDVLTSHALEGYDPSREEVVVAVDMAAGRIDGDTYMERIQLITAEARRTRTIHA